MPMVDAIYLNKRGNPHEDLSGHTTGFPAKEITMTTSKFVC